MEYTTVDMESMLANAGQATRMLKALSNPHRLLILCHLSGGEKCVGELSEALAGGGLSQPGLSQHLARLREDGLVDTRRQAQTIFYRLAGDAVTRIIGLLYEIYCDDDGGPQATA